MRIFDFGFWTSDCDGQPKRSWLIPWAAPANPKSKIPNPKSCGRGFTLIEMLTVLVILVFLITFFGKRFMGLGAQGRVRATQQLINKIGIALARYQAECRTLPPDTGYGQPLGTETGGTPQVVTYDSGSLWRYLSQPVVKRRSDGTVIEQLGPYVSFKYDPAGYTELLPYRDPSGGKSFYVVDAWGKPIGYVGSPKRVIHNRGFADIYSGGPDGVTAEDPKVQLPPNAPSGPNQAYQSDGDVSTMGRAALNGCLTQTMRGAPETTVLDDINNWDPQR